MAEFFVKAMLDELDIEGSDVLKYNVTPSSGTIKIDLKDNKVIRVEHPF